MANGVFPIPNLDESLSNQRFYREEYLEDIEDIPSKKLQSSIKKAEQHDFADYVSDYLI